MLDKFYSVDDVAEKFSVKPSTVRRWIRNGQLNAKKLGNKYIITEQELSRYVDALLPN